LVTLNVMLLIFKACTEETENIRIVSSAKIMQKTDFLPASATAIKPYRIAIIVIHSYIDYYQTEYL
jgi:hypothetical protein